jgi:hypothetical protein
VREPASCNDVFESSQYEFISISQGNIDTKKLFRLHQPSISSRSYAHTGMRRNSMYRKTGNEPRAFQNHGRPIYRMYD